MPAKKKRAARKERQMRVVSVHAQKGGVGKSTIAEALAVSAELEGLKVGLLDFDPQGSSLSWAARRASRGVESPPVGYPGKKTARGYRVTPSSLQEALEAAKEDGFELMILDTPARLEESVAHAAEVSDLVLVVVCPAAKDIDAVAATVGLIKRSRKPSVLVLNKGRGAAINQDVTRMLGETYGLPLCPIFISLRMPIVDADLTGHTLPEYSSKEQSVKKGKEEFKALWGWVRKRVEAVDA